MHEKERFVRSGGVFGLDDVVGDFDASGRRGGCARSRT